MASLWNDRALAHTLEKMGSPQPASQTTRRTAIGSLDDALPMAGGID
jgi:hypothetical protein